MKVRLPNGAVIQGFSRGESLLLFDEIFVKRTYLRHGIELCEGDHVIDVGANLGMFALFLGQTLREFTLHAFEPVPDVYKKLDVNTHGLKDKVTLFNLGLADRDGEVEFAYYPHLPAYSTAFPDRLDRRWADLHDILMRMTGERAGNLGLFRRPVGWVRSAVVRAIVAYASVRRKRVCRVTTLSKTLRTHPLSRIDLLKIDAEGSDWDVLRGIDDDDWAKVRQVAMEVHDVEGGPDAIREWLVGRGFDVTVEIEDEGRRAPLCMLYARRPVAVEARELNAAAVQPA